MTVAGAFIIRWSYPRQLGLCKVDRELRSAVCQHNTWYAHGVLPTHGLEEHRRRSLWYLAFGFLSIGFLLRLDFACHLVLLAVVKSVEEYRRLKSI